MHKPSWFRPGSVLVSYAPTCGINKDGEELFRIDEAAGLRTDEIDDLLRADVKAALSGRSTPTLDYVPFDDIRQTGYAVPVYYDYRSIEALEYELDDNMPGFKAVSLGDLISAGVIEYRIGHGSPSSDLRSGDIPYIKVSDLRAGQVNINPTNRVSSTVAERYWRGTDSGLLPYDLITPLRTSKNIGEFAVLMPGQERVVLTKEVLVLRPGPNATFDQFYLAWAMSLKVVRQQWGRIVFMQTNREDTGTRYREIVIPVPEVQEEAALRATPFREYYEGAARLRASFLDYLTQDDKHHVFLSSNVVTDEADYD